MEPVALVFQAGDRVYPILGALFMYWPAEARDDPVVDLLNGRAGILRQQESLINDGSRRHARDVGIGWNSPRYSPVAAAGAVARGIVRRALGGRDLRRRGCVLNSVGLASNAVRCG